MACFSVYIDTKGSNVEYEVSKYGPCTVNCMLTVPSAKSTSTETENQ